MKSTWSENEIEKNEYMFIIFLKPMVIENIFLLLIYFVSSYLSFIRSIWGEGFQLYILLFYLHFFWFLFYYLKIVHCSYWKQFPTSQYTCSDCCNFRLRYGSDNSARGKNLAWQCFILSKLINIRVGWEYT